MTYKDSHNQTVLDRLVREVKALNSVYLTQHIKGIATLIIILVIIELFPSSTYTDAAYRFYRSRCEETSTKRRGMHQAKNKSKRKHERTIRVSYTHGLALF